MGYGKPGKMGTYKDVGRLNLAAVLKKRSDTQGDSSAIMG